MPKLESKNDVAVISPEGELGHREMAEVKNVISRALADGEPRIVLNLAGVDHVKYTTLGVLGERRLRLKACGGDLRLVTQSDYLLQILRFAGVHDHFLIFPSVGEAVESYLEEEEPFVFAGQSRSWVPRLQ